MLSIYIRKMPKSLYVQHSLWWFNSPYFNLPSPSSVVTFKTNNLTTMVAGTLVATRGYRIGLELPQSPIPRELSVFELLVAFLEALFSEFVFELARNSLCALSIHRVFVKKKYWR